MNLRIHILSENLHSLSLSKLLALRINLTIPILLVAIFFAALSLVYAANEVRVLNSQIVNLQYDKQQLLSDWEKLLLEESTLTVPRRIQYLAETNLHMLHPTINTTININK